jgi:hypothetical protein
MQPTPANVRCTACGSGDVMPPTLFDLSGSTVATMTFRPRDAKPGFLGVTVLESLRVDRARVCLACGHVMLALRPETLAQLRAKAAMLDPVLP